MRSVLQPLERCLHLRRGRRAIAAAANRDLRREEILVAILELRQSVPTTTSAWPYDGAVSISLPPSSGNCLQRRRGAAGSPPASRVLIDDRRADADDRQLLAGRRNRALDQRAGLRRADASSANAGRSAERERGTSADAELDGIAA